MERWGEDAALVGELRSWLGENGVIRARVAEGKEEQGAKYRDYFEHAESLAKIPSHRLLALFRARREEILFLELDPGTEAEAGHVYAEGRVAYKAGIADAGRPGDRWLLDACRLTWRAKLHMHLLLDLFNQAREKAEAEAIAVFGDNLKDLLLAAPAGPRATLGLDPGLRTGCKVAVVDATGKLLDHATVYPHVPHNKWDQTLAILAALCAKHAVDLIAIGNGTASRETDKLAAELIKKYPAMKMTKVMVSEAGASVYSASELASKEFPDLDVSIRGAVSIARRLQDPLAELVKIDPKSIGVGQYQHDVSQLKLARGLDAVVEDCVNKVGVDVNTASVALLARISGLNSTLAQNIVTHRDENGAFKTRAALKKVARLGEKTFEQAAGFLRVMNGDNPLDASAVHPEAYPLVQRIAAETDRDIRSLIGDAAFLKRLDPKKYTDETFGVPTITDILQELEKPGRDPRPEFKTAEFQDGVEDLKDLQLGMILEGVVTNVTNFGAFVDIGVHQDGLVHISALSEKFIKDPREAVKAGDVVKVKVMEVDIPRKRVGLSMRMSDTPGEKIDGARGARPGSAPRQSQNSAPRKETATAAPSNNAMASLFANAKQLKKR